MARVATEYGMTAKRVMVAMAKIGKVQALLTDTDATIRAIGQERCKQAAADFMSAASAMASLAGVAARKSLGDSEKK